MVRSASKATLLAELEATEDLHRSVVELLSVIHRDVGRILCQLANVVQYIDDRLNKIG